MTGLYHAHSGLRYLVFLVGLIAALLFLYGIFAKRPAGKAERIAMATFTGVLDLQVLLGIALVAMGIFYGALMGHLMMMVLAAISAHAAGVMARRTTDHRRAHSIRLAGVVLALVLIMAGIMAIGRSVLGTGVPAITG